jgi:hypothetical protein
MGTCEGNKKGDRGGGSMVFCFSLEPYSKISLVIIKIIFFIFFFFLTMYKSYVQIMKVGPNANGIIIFPCSKKYMN